MYVANENYLMHHGIKGQKWGIRKYQNPDGSLTEAGKKRYAGDMGLVRRWRDSKKAAKKQMSIKERILSNIDIGAGENKSYQKKLALTRKESGMSVREEEMAKRIKQRNIGIATAGVGAAYGALSILSTLRMDENGKVKMAPNSVAGMQVAQSVLVGGIGAANIINGQVKYNKAKKGETKGTYNNLNSSLLENLSYTKRYK